MEVTERGELIALMVPPQRSYTARDRLISMGKLIPARCPTGRVRSPRPMPIAAPGAAQAAAFPLPLAELDPPPATCQREPNDGLEAPRIAQWNLMVVRTLWIRCW